MEREYLIKKWLDNELTPEEEIAFKALEDASFLIDMSNDIKAAGLKSDFNVEQGFSKLKDTIELKKNRKPNLVSLKFLTKIAAIVVLGLSIFFYATGKKDISTVIGETKVFVLPDNSKVTIDASSSINIKRFNWNRNVALKGEAYFEVEKGKKFKVTTKEGTVEVLGTKFNVISRDHYFEIVCYEGRVLVSYNAIKKTLNAGDRFLVVDTKIMETKNTKNKATEWNSNESIFRSTPVKYVLKEFERHYNTKIKANFNTNEIFTGSFVHDNQILALKSITLPLNLKVKKESNRIILSKND